jgi:hypothetical protein
LPHESSLEKALVWLREKGFEITNDDCYIAQLSEIRDQVRRQQQAQGPARHFSLSPSGETHAPAAVRAKEWVWEGIG